MRLSLAFSLGTLLAGAVTVHGRTGPLGPENNYLAPPGVQIGTVSQDLVCTISIAGLIPLSQSAVNVKFAGAAPNAISRDTAFYVTSGRAILTIPENVTTQLASIGVSAISGQATSVIVKVPGSQEDTIDLAKLATLTIPNTPVKGGQDLVITIPALDQPALSIGTVHPNATSNDILIGVGSAQVAATAYIGILGVPASASCPEVSPTHYLAFTTVGDNVQGVVARPDGNYNPVSTLPDSSIIGSTGIAYVCDVDGVGSLNIPISLTAFGSVLSVKPGQQFAFQNGHGTITISPENAAAVVKSLPASSQTVTAFQFALSELNFNAVNASPQTLNALGGGVQSDKVSYNPSNSTALAVDIPGNNGLLAPITYTAGSSGTILTYLGDVKGQILVYGQDLSVPVATLNFACPALTNPPHGLLPLTIAAWCSSFHVVVSPAGL